MKIYCYKSTS